MKTIHLFLALFLFSNITGAQTIINPIESTPYIEVTGEGSMEVVPDEIFLQFTLKERYDGRDKISLDDLEKKLYALLRKNGFNPEDLSLANANADYVTVKWRKKDVLASKDYVLKIKTTDELSKVWQILDEIGADNAFIRKVDHSQMEELKKQVKIDAVKNAKEKAGYLLAAVGEKVGKVLFLQERENFTPVYTMRTKQANTEVLDTSADTGLDNPEISFQKIKLNYKVFARFAIEEN